MKYRAAFAVVLAIALAACGRPPLDPATVPAPAETPVAAAPTPAVPSTDGIEAADDPAPLQAEAVSPDVLGTTGLRSDGTVLSDGQPFFPFGYYHVSWASTPAQRLTDMGALATAGFNTMAVSIIDDADMDRFGTFLDSAASRNMKIVTEGIYASRLGGFASKKSVLGWSVADDCNSRYTVTQVAQRAAEAQAADPRHLTYASLATSYGSPHTAYFNTTGMMGNQSYPVTSDLLLDSLKETYDMTSLAVRQATVNGRAAIANLQSFSWNVGPGYAPAATLWPRGLEVENMTYQALAAGARGVLYYTYLDQFNSVRKQPEVWNATVKLASEVKRLSPVLLNGTRRTLGTNVAEVVATAWNYQGVNYVTVVNTSRLSGFNVNVPLGTAATTRTAMYGRPATLAVKNNALVGYMKPLEVHLYTVK